MREGVSAAAPGCCVNRLPFIPYARPMPRQLRGSGCCCAKVRRVKVAVHATHARVQRAKVAVHATCMRVQRVKVAAHATCMRVQRVKVAAHATCAGCCCAV